MEAIWNEIQLPTPVITSLPLQCSKPYETVVRLKSITNEIKTTMYDFRILNSEAATLSRLIYKLKHKFRQEKSFKALQKINRCLTNYLTMHLPFTLGSIGESLHNNCGPTRQMMEWALVRLYGFAHLFHRVYLLCIDAAGHLMVKIKLSQLWDTTIFTLAVVSRIWTFAQLLVSRSCQWYVDFHFFLDKLGSTSTAWLQKGVVLPSNLAETLDNPDYLNVKQLSKPSDMLSQLDSPLNKEDKFHMTSVLDRNMFDDIGEAVSRGSKENKQDLVNKHKPLNNDMKRVKKKKKRDIASNFPFKYSVSVNLSMDTSDLGLPVLNNHSKQEENGDTSCADVNSYSKHKNKSKKEKQAFKKYEHSINNIQSSQDLLKFLKYEDNARSAFLDSGKHNPNHQGVFNIKDKLQWTMIQKFLKKHVNIIKKLEVEGSISKKNKILEKVHTNIRTWSSA